MEFELPETLDGLTLAQLIELAEQADAAFTAATADVDTSDPSTITPAIMDAMRALTSARETLTERIEVVRAEDTARADEARALLDAHAVRTEVAAEPEPPAEPVVPAEPEAEQVAEVVAEAEQAVADAAAPVTASAQRPVSFKGLGAQTGRSAAASAPRTEIGFRMQPNVPRFVEGIVGFRELAAAIDSMAPGSTIRSNRRPVDGRADMTAMSLATLERDHGDRIISSDNEDEIAAEVDRIIDASTFTRATHNSEGALTAAAGWCSPSETIYTFCDVNPAEGLISLPDMNIQRGGIRRPIDPDFSELYATLPFRYTETELMANPTKPCIEIPCTTMEEIRAEAIGLCVTAGILQRRGWPELIARFMQEVTKAHLVKLHTWTIQDMIAGSTAISFTAAGAPLGASTSLLNSLSLRAVVIRQKEGLPHNALIEGVAPSHALKTAAADMAMQQGRDVKSVTDAQVDQWLADRNIRIQWVSHWQQLPEGSIFWPNSVQILLYPSGAWFRHLANVIEVGTLYDKAQLQQNRYTEIFTEDEYLVDNRCKVSEAITVPLCVDGSVGARETVTCAATVNEVQTLTITGTPTGGTWTATFGGQTTDPIAYNATAAVVQAALAKLPSIKAGNVLVTGSAGGPYTVTFVGALGATNVGPITTADALTGGTSPEVTVAQTTPGAPN